MGQDPTTQDRTGETATPSQATDWSEQPAVAAEPPDTNPSDAPLKPTIIEADIAILGDLRSLREPGWQVAQEVRVQAAAGYRTTLVHTPTRDTHVWNHINPEIQMCVKEGLAQPVDPKTSLIQTDLLVVRQPHAVLPDLDLNRGAPIPRIFAKNTLACADAATLHADPSALRQKDRLFRNLFGGDVRWTAADPTEFSQLRQAHHGLQFDDEPWTTAISVEPAFRGRATDSLPIFGRVCFPDGSDWPEDETSMRVVYPVEPFAHFRLFGLPRPGRLPLRVPPLHWEFFRAGEIGWRRFLQSLDFLLYYPSDSPFEVPLTPIRWVMAHGAVVILPPELEPLVGKGPVYAPAQSALAEAEQLYADRTKYDALTTSARRHVEADHGPALYLDQVARFTRPQPAAPTPVRPGSRRVMFMSSNGVGLGHLTRLLAIARRLPPDIEPVFATMSQAASTVAQCGFPVEYIPSHLKTQSDVQDWNAWLTLQIDQLLRFYDARHIVFDGNHAYSGLIRAIADRPDDRLVWIRRGMWQAGQPHEPFIARQKFFDLIIEPDDIASSRDQGATVHHRSQVLTVPPIRMLDTEELLPRSVAAKKLGLDPAQPAMLIQLGSGANRDIVSLADRILASAKRYPQLQIVMAEWLMSDNSFAFWPEAKKLRGFPISRYFAAFDFTVSAAGYNSFNELMSFGLPAIFSANTHASMDDQAARAAYAEEQGAGFHWSLAHADILDQLIDALMDKDARRTLKVNALRIARPNGAVDAAAAIAGLID